MPSYEVQYSYDEPQFGEIIVEAEDIRSAEFVALNRLREDINIPACLQIESVEEIKNA